MSGSDFEIANNIIRNNIGRGGVRGGGRGGGLAILDLHFPSTKEKKYSSGTVKNNIITGNTGGGPFSEGGGILNTADSGVLIINNTIIGNSSRSGGGIHNSGGAAILANIIVNNSGGQIGGGIYSTSSSALLDYNNVWGNTLGPQDPNNPNSPNSNVPLGTHSISVDPYFVDAENGDYHLLSGSPCIGMGTLSDVPDTDIEGNPRPNPSDSNPDIGAYEHSWANPLITNSDGGAIVLPGNAALIIFPSGATPQDVDVSIVKLDDGAIPPVNGGFKLLGNIYEFTATNTLGEPVTNFDDAVQMTLKYDPDTLGGINEQTLKIHYYDDASGQWVELPSTVDTENQVVTAITDHFTKFALFIPEIPVYPTETPHPPNAIPEPATFLLLGLGLIGIFTFMKKMKRE